MISKNKIKNISSYTFQILIVIGGSWTLDSTETFDSDLGNWVTSGAKMPRPMDGLRAANTDGRVLFFGNIIHMYIKLESKSFSRLSVFPYCEDDQRLKLFDSILTLLNTPYTGYHRDMK